MPATVKNQPGRVIADLVNMDPDLVSLTNSTLETFQLPLGPEDFFEWKSYDPSEGPRRLTVYHTIRYRMGSFIPTTTSVEAPLPMKRGIDNIYNYVNPQPEYFTPTKHYRYAYFSNAFRFGMQISDMEMRADPKILGINLNQARVQEQQIKRVFVFHLLQNSPLAGDFTQTFDYDTTLTGDEAIDQLVAIPDMIDRSFETRGLPSTNTTILVRKDLLNAMIKNLGIQQAPATTFETYIHTSFKLRTYSFNGYTFIGMPESQPMVMPDGSTVQMSLFEPNTNMIVWSRTNVQLMLFLSWFNELPLTGGRSQLGTGFINEYFVEQLSYYGGEITDTRYLIKYVSSQSRDKNPDFTYPSDMKFTLTSGSDVMQEPSDMVVKEVEVPALSTVITTTELGELADKEAATIQAAVVAKNANATDGYTITDITDTTANATGDGTKYTGTVALTFTVKAAEKFDIKSYQLEVENQVKEQYEAKEKEKEEAFKAKEKELKEKEKGLLEQIKALTKAVKKGNKPTGETTEEKNENE